MPCSCNGNGNGDYHGPTLMGYGYKPQAGSPGIAPSTWRIPVNVYKKHLGAYPHAPLGLLPHQDEQRALEMVRRRLALGNVTTDATRDPHVTGMVRALQTRVASVAASQNGGLTRAQHAQAQQVRRQIARRQGLAAYVATDFQLIDPLDTGTSVSEVAAQNFPLMTNGATPGTGQGDTTPAPAPTGPSFTTLAIAGAAIWYFFVRKK